MKKLILILMVMAAVSGCVSAAPTNTPTAGTRSVVTDTNNVLTGASTNLFLANSNLLAAAIGSISTNGFATAITLAGTNDALVFLIKTVGTNMTNYANGLAAGLQPLNSTLTALSGTTTNKFVSTNDARLTDARTPLAHGHVESDVTNLVTDLAGKLAAALNLSDLPNTTSARGNLGVISATATSNLVSALTALVVMKAANGSDFTNAALVRANIGVAAATNPIFTGVISGGLRQEKTNFDASSPGWYGIVTNKATDTGISGIGEIVVSNVSVLRFFYSLQAGGPSGTNSILAQAGYSDSLFNITQLRATQDGSNHCRLDVNLSGGLAGVQVKIYGDQAGKLLGGIYGVSGLGEETLLTPDETSGVASGNHAFNGTVAARDFTATGSDLGLIQLLPVDMDPMVYGASGNALFAVDPAGNDNYLGLRYNDGASRVGFLIGDFNNSLSSSIGGNNQLRSYWDMDFGIVGGGANFNFYQGDPSDGGTLVGQINTGGMYATAFNDFSASPTNTADAWEIVNSHSVTNGRVDHTKLSSRAWGTKLVLQATGKMVTNKVFTVSTNAAGRRVRAAKMVVGPEKKAVEVPDQKARNLSMTISALLMANQDLRVRLEKLEAAGKK